jgi:hypothetical protein
LAGVFTVALTDGRADALTLALLGGFMAVGWMVDVLGWNNCAD